MKTSYFSLLGDVGEYIIDNIFTPIFNAVMDALSVILYGIQIGLFHIINAIQGVVRGLVGLQPHWVEVDGVVKRIDSDPAVSFLQDPKVQSTFLSILIAAIFLLVITTFVGIIKTEFDKKDNSKTPVIENAIKGLVYFFLVPVTCFIGIFVANVVLKMLDKATANGASRFSNQIFVAAAFDSNRIRRDHDPNAVGEAYKYYIGKSNTREVISPFTEYVLNKINTNCYEVVIEENNEIKTVYALKKAYFSDEPNLTSGYISVDPAKFIYEFKLGEYYSSLNEREQAFVDNVVDMKISIKDLYTHPDSIYQLNYEPQEPPNVDDPIEITVPKGTHVISLKEFENGVDISGTIVDIDAISAILQVNSYYFFVAPLSSEQSYYTANASFHEDLKLSEHALVEFPMVYRVDLLGAAATALKIVVGIGGDFNENFGEVEAVRLSGFDEADYLAFANWVDNQFLTGYFDITNFKETATFYELGYYNYIIGYIAAGMIVTMLINLVIGCIQRIFEISVLFVVSPAVISLMPLDGGDRYKSWRGEFVKRVFSAYGPILGMNLAFMVLQMIQTTKLKLFPPHEDLYNGIIYILLMFTALVCVKSLTKLVTNLVGQGDALKDGEETTKQVKDLALKTAGVLSGAAAMPIALARRGMDMMQRHQGNQEKFYDHTYFNRRGDAITEDEFKAGKMSDGTLINKDEWQLGRDRWSGATSASVRKRMKESAAAVGADTRTRRLLDYGYAVVGAHKDLANMAVDTFMDDDKKKDIIKKIGKGTPLGKILKAPLDEKEGKKAVKDAADKMKTEAAAKAKLNKELPKDKQLSTTPGVMDVVNHGGNGSNPSNGSGGGSNGGSGGSAGGSSNVRNLFSGVDLTKVKNGDEAEIKRAKRLINQEIGHDSNLTNDERKAQGQRVSRMTDNDAIARMVKNAQNGQSASAAATGVVEDSKGYNSVGRRIANKASDIASSVKQSLSDFDTDNLNGFGKSLVGRLKKYKKDVSSEIKRANKTINNEDDE